MIDLQDISRIGFGGYRLSNHCAEHYKALIYALKQGCNLLDTAGTYSNGQSEKLIGRVLQDHPDLPAFVVTKAGYASKDALTVLQRLQQQGRVTDNIDIMPAGWKHCIHPDFLQTQLSASLQRLNRKYIDGYLLHNPEYYYTSISSAADADCFYKRIFRAFEFLEGQVAKGIIRYYGISSNTFPLSTTLASTTNLRRVLEAAREVSSSHHCKLIQFPFNLYENGAVKAQQEGSSLLAVAKAHKIITFGNRPLNANSPSGPVRLASYEYALASLNPVRDQALFRRVIQRITEQLVRIGADTAPESYAVLDFLLNNWMALPSQSAAETVFREHLSPFLLYIYAGRVPVADKRLYLQFKKTMRTYALMPLNTQQAALQNQLVSAGLIPADDQRNLSVVACEQYLKAGIDHVLVGMRKKAYVDTLVPLF